MAKLIWGDPADRSFESGLDRGVLFMPDGSAVPWNGLISIVEKFEKDTEVIYFDGQKIAALVSPGEFSATMRAASYPRAFDELESFGHLRRGVLVGDQPPQYFGLSWRTMKGNDARGVNAGYRLNVAYNLIAAPSDRSYQTRSNDPSLVEFEWELSAVPEEVPGMRPSAHFVLESDEVDPWLLDDIESWLYGTIGADGQLPPLAELVEFMADWARVTITDNLDGTWTATERRDRTYLFHDPDDPDIVELRKVNAVWMLGQVDEEYTISDTKDRAEKLDIRVNPDGTWVAITEQDILVDDGVFTLYDVDPTVTSPDMFRIKSKT